MFTRITRSRPVLMYHGVGPSGEDPFGLFVSPGRFALQMQTLRLLGLRGVSLGEFGDAAARDQADGLVGLTFDDGYRDVLRWVPDVLERHGFTATIFAVSGLAGGENVWDPPPRRSLLTQGDLEDLAGRGWEVGSHSVSHPHLTEVGHDRLRHEVVTSRVDLTAITGTPPRSFCYPYGSVDAIVADVVREAGYSYACAVRRVAGLPEAFTIPRVGVTERDRGSRFVAKLFLRGR